MSGSNGGLAVTQYVTEQFAKVGIPSLAVAYFKYPSLQDTLNLIPLEYIEKAIAWLKQNTSAKRFAICGISKGAEYALSAAACFFDIGCVVAVVPNYYVAEAKARA